MPREVWLECPDCGGMTRLDQDSDLPEGDSVRCTHCLRELGKLAKQALMRAVAVRIATQLVERENRSFFDELEQQWRTR